METRGGLGIKMIKVWQKNGNDYRYSAIYQRIVNPRAENKKTSILNQNRGFVVMKCSESDNTCAKMDRVLFGLLPSFYKSVWMSWVLVLWQLVC